MSSRITSTLHGFAVFFYVLAGLAVLGWTIIAFDVEEFSYFAIGLGCGLIITWLGLVLDGLHVIAMNTERSTQFAVSDTSAVRRTEVYKDLIK